MKIRTAQTGDAAALTALTLRSKAHWGYSAAFMAACRSELSISHDDISIPGTLYRVAERDPEVLLGYHALVFLDRVSVELDALFVDPPYIGSGVGRALIEDAVNAARTSGAQRLMIQGDPHAESFYLAAGGRRVGSRESQSIPGRHLPLFEIALRE